MRFQVPQFTEVEDKVIGPLTLKQFIYLAGAVGACIILYTLLPKFISFVLMIPVLVLGAALAFYKVNNRPFIRVLESSVKYFIASKLYIWKHKEKKIVSEGQTSKASVFVPKLSESKLRDLTWSLDVKQNLDSGEIKQARVNEGKIDLSV